LTKKWIYGKKQTAKLLFKHPVLFHFQIQRIRDGAAQTVLWRGTRSRQSDRLR
jgi:hypothetical protein